MYQKWLQAFHYVARENSFTKAASCLNVGQPTISTHVSHLEEYFGVELFLRQRRKILLTLAGENLYAITQDIFRHKKEAIAYLNRIKNLNSGELNFSAARPYDVMELLVALRDKRPGIKYSVSLTTSENIIKDVLSFRADIGIVSRKFSDEAIHSVFYRQHKVFIVVHKNHRLANRNQIRLAELEGEEMIVRTTSSTTQEVFDQAAVSEGITIKPAFEMESREGMREAIIRGLGIGVVSETAFAPHKNIRPLTVIDADLYTRAYIVCLAVRKNRPLIREFLTMAGNMAKPLDA